MSIYHKAVENVGREVLLVRDNKVIGEGYSQTSAYGMISIEMRDERAQALIADAPQVKLWAERFPEKKFKYSLYKFCQFTGQYIDMTPDDPDMNCPNLEGVFVVDKFNLRYGMVPDSFKSMEEYHSISKEFRQSKEQDSGE